MSYSERSNPSGSSSLVRKIYRACRVSLSEPDLSLNLAVADYVNDKQGSAPREAALNIVNLINSKDPHTSVFALALLDVLVKNCGYPFHLQISRKEFLNELVKRFPERPPARYSKVQRLILGAIEEWNQTICKTSRYKADLGFIRDMHRLLTYKGYTFPEVKAEDASVLNPSDNLKSIAEVQKEEQIAQSAKLQELVRRGRPSDLKEANKLMKIMAGFKDDNIVDSRAKVAEDLDRLKRKCDIFSEMLEASQNAGQFDSTDETLIELFSSLKVAQPKIQKIIEEESDDEAAVQDLLRLNDTVNSLIEKYSLLKAGDTANASKVKIASAGSGLQTSLNLIDLEDDSNTPEPNSNSTVDDLLGELGSLSFSNPQTTSFGIGGDITIGSPIPQLQSQPLSYPHAQAEQAHFGTNYDIFSNLSSTQQTQQTQPALPKSATGLDGFDLLSEVSAIQETPSSGSKITVSQSSNLKFEIDINRESPSTIQVNANFSNVQAHAISNFQVLLAVPKSLQLRLEPQSGSFLPSFGQNAVSQFFRIDGAHIDSTVKIKWKVDYIVNNSPVEETSTFVFPLV